MKEKIIELQKLKVKQFCAFSRENTDALLQLLTECKSFLKGETEELSDNHLYIKEYLVMNGASLLNKEELKAEDVISFLETNFSTVYESEYDKYIRLYADFENFKKRYYADIKTERETTKYNTLSSLLDVVTDFERAKKLISVSNDTSLKEGIELIMKKVTSFLEQQGIIEVDNTTFDPDMHEAISVLEVEGTEAGAIVEVLEKGYKMGDTVVRHSKVVVSK